MTKSDTSSDLNVLIQGLSRMEMRYFRRYAAGLGGEGEHAYLKLYNFLCREPQADDTAIRAEFAGEAFLKQLPVAKNYLFHQILEALASFDRGKSTNLDLAERLVKVEILFRRRHYVAAAHQLVWARKQAKEMEMPAKELEVLRWEMRLVRTHGGTKMEEKLQDLQSQADGLMSKLKLEHELIGLHDKAFALLHRRAALTPEEARLLSQDLIQSPWLMPEQLANAGFEGKVMAAYVRAWTGLIKGEATVYWEEHKVLLAIWDANPGRKRLEQDRYFRTLFSYLDSCMHIGQAQEALAAISKLKRLIRDSKELAKTDGHRVYYAEWIYRMNLLQIEQAALVAPALVESLKSAKSMATQMLVSIHANLAGMWFFMENWEECLKWLDVLLRKFSEHLQPDLRFSIRVLRILCCLETAEVDRAKSYALALKKHMATQFRPSGFELQALALLLEMVEDESGQESQDQQQAFWEMMVERKDENRPFASEMRIWAKSRVQGCQLLEVLRKDN